MRSNKKRWMLLGGISGATMSAVVVGALGVFAGSGVAASTARPQPITQPTVTGTPQEGQTLTGHNGRWANNPTDFNFFWMRCNANGGSCANIIGAHAATYTLNSVDVGNTVRFKVQARNNDGSTFAVSAQTAEVTKAGSPTPPPPSPGPPPPSKTGCPPGTGTAQASDLTEPAKMILDGQQGTPNVVTSSTTDLTLRYHVSDSCGQNVQGALVYSTAVPFNQWSIPAEVPTGPDGWATMTMHRLKGFPVSSHQQLIALFARARRSGESLLSGLSTRRLFSLPVNLKAG